MGGRPVTPGLRDGAGTLAGGAGTLAGVLEAGTVPGALLPRGFFARPALEVAPRLLSPTTSGLLMKVGFSQLAPTSG